MKSLKEQVKELKRKRREEEEARISQPEKKAAVSSKKKPPAKHSSKPLYVSVGIDFGTTYTKVAWKDIATDAAGFVDFPTTDATTPFLDSQVRIDESGRCYTPLDKGFAKARRAERFLKMRIAGSRIYETEPSGTKQIAASVEALSAFYLGRVIQYSCEHFRNSEAERVAGRTVNWLPSLGIPTRHYDSPLRERFERILAAAWKMSSMSFSGPSAEEIQHEYESIDGARAAAKLPVFTYPEIGAAVLSFLVSPEAQPGVYIYFDVGGGTLDGVSFRYRNRGGDRSVEYYSAVVEELGVEAVAERLRRLFTVPDIALFREALIGGREGIREPLGYKEVKPDVQRAVAEVVAGGRLRNKSQDWRVSRVDDGLYYQWFPEYLRDDKVQKLPVFVGGGGWQSKHHQSWIRNTYGDFKHHNAGIPPYELTALPVPPKLQQDATHSSQYNRLAVAYGLTAAPATSVKTIGLPSHATVEKDVREAHYDFDAIATEIYGEPL
ncbi:MAG: hypothetical protein ACOCRN_03880 [Spirochaetia bacterium]